MTRTNARVKTAANLLGGAGVCLALCGWQGGANAQTTPPVPSVTVSAKPADTTKPADKAANAAPTAPPHIEEQAMALLKRNQQAMFALKTYAAECRTVQTRDKLHINAGPAEYMLATLQAEKPNKMRYDSWDLDTDPTSAGWIKPTSAAHYTYACDGKDNYKQFGRTYNKYPNVKPEDLSTILEPWYGFYATNNSVYGMALKYRKKNELREARLAGREAVDGVMCDKVIVAVTSSYNGKRYDNQATWYFGPDGLTRRCITHISFDGKPGSTRDATLTNIRLNKPADAALYVYTPPRGVTLQADEKQVPLLANGTLAPDFTAYDINKKTVKLADLRGKIVVIDFWASWCPPCNAAMPHNQAVMKKLQAEGLPVVLLAVDDGESREAFDIWVKQKSAELSALTFVYVPPTEGVSASRFKVTGIPTQYVLDKNGAVCASFVGYDGPTDDLEKAVRAAILK